MGRSADRRGPAAETLLGYPVQTIQEHPRLLVKTVHPEDRSRVYAARQVATAGGYDETYRVVRPDGELRIELGGKCLDLFGIDFEPAGAESLPDGEIFEMEFGRHWDIGCLEHCFHLETRIRNKAGRVPGLGSGVSPS